MINVNVKNGVLSEEEKQAYISRSLSRQGY